jgi:hypothetical protein
VILKPRPVGGWRVSEESLRGESPKQYSSVRLVVERAGIKIRLKQTFNDWWVPVANDINLRRIEGHFLLGDEVVTTGKDYHGRPGACAQLFGTTVEAYLLEGLPLEKHWIECYQALEPAVPAAVADARRTPFAERNYWMRWTRDVGPWDSHEFTKPTWMRPDPQTFEKVAWASTPDQWAPMPGAPDSIAARQDGKRREMQVLFRQPMTLNYTSWLRIVEPPEKEGPVASRDPRYPKLSKRTQIKQHEVQYAALLEAVGAWFFFWEHQGRSHELHIRAQKGLDEATALRVARSIIT